MYRLNDRQGYIKRLQKYLGIRESGIIDEKMEAEIKRIQNKMNISSAEYLNKETFEMLKKHYKEQLVLKKNKAHYPVTLPAKKEDYNTGVGIINSLMERIASYHNLPFKKTRGKYFSDESVLLTRLLCRLFQIKERDFADVEFFNRLCLENEAVDILEKNN